MSDDSVLKEKAHKKFGASRTWLASKFPFFGNLLLSMKMKSDCASNVGVKAAAVDNAGNLYLNHEFVDSLSEKEFRFVLMHEVLHPALLFFSRQKGRDSRLFNIAHDYAINLAIEEVIQTSPHGAGVEIPSGNKAPLLDKKYSGMSAEEIYDLLEKENWQDQFGFFVQDAMEDESEKALGESNKEQWRMRVARAMNASRSSKWGSLPAGLQKSIDEILHPQVDWTAVLGDYVSQALGGDFYTFSRTNRRSEAAGAILAGKDSDSRPEVTVLWDTSGSQSGWENTVFAEVKSLQEDLATKFRLMVIDTELYADMMLDDVDEALSQLKGGGGSDFRPAFTKLEEENDDSLVIAFTDGLISVPAVPPPLLSGVLWVLTGEATKPPASYGSIIHIKEGRRVRR